MVCATNAPPVFLLRRVSAAGEAAGSALASARAACASASGSNASMSRGVISTTSDASACASGCFMVVNAHRLFDTACALG